MRAAFLVNVMAQVVIAIVGVVYLYVTDLDSILWLVAWTSLASIYAIVVIIVLGRSSKRELAPDQVPSRMQLSRPARILTAALTYLTSIIGLSSAVQVIIFRDHPELGILYNVVGVWAMILAWGFMHWGFAQLYLQNYYLSDPRTLRFPNTQNPSLVDFAYFSYTVGTSFAASDVEIQTTRTRWNVLWHSVLSFFFNSLIIVLAMNIIISADFSGLF